MSAPTHLLTLNGAETVAIVGVDPKDGLACIYEICTTQDIADLAGGGGLTPANPTATAGPTVINGSSNHFMRADAAPAVQKGTDTIFGIVKVDGTSITSSGGTISAAIPTGTNPTATAGPTAINGTSNTFMRSDAAPAVQLGSSSQKGIVQVDNVTITASAGVISATGTTLANPTATAGPTAVNGVATTAMRSDAAPAVQKGSNAQFGICEGDGSTVTVVAGVISVNLVPANKISLTNGDILVGNVSNVAADVAMSGDVTIANTGVTTIKASLKTADIAFVISGGGSTITTGTKGYLFIYFPCTITQSTLLANASGSIVVNIWECAYAQFDAGSTHPVVGDKITGSTPPTISSATKAQDSTLSGWTTSISAGSVLAFNVDSVSGINQVTLTLKVTKT